MAGLFLGHFKMMPNEPCKFGIFLDCYPTTRRCEAIFEGSDNLWNIHLCFTKPPKENDTEFEVPFYIIFPSGPWRDLVPGSTFELRRGHRLLANATVLAEITDPAEVQGNSAAEEFLSLKRGHCTAIFTDCDVEKFKSKLLERMSANWPKPSQHKITATDQRLNEALFHQLPNVTSKPVDVDIIHFSGTAPIDTLSESLLFEDTVCVVVQRPVGAPVVTSSFNSEPSFYGPHEVWLNRVHVISPKLTPIWIFTLDNPDFHEESAKFVNDVLKVCEELCP